MNPRPGTGSCRGRAVWADGVFRDPDAPLFPPFESSLLRGLGLIESFRMLRGRPIPDFGVHLQRLRWGAGRLAFGPVPPLEEAEIRDELLERAGLDEGRGRLHLLPAGARPRFLWTVEPLPEPPPPLRLTFSPFRRGNLDPTASLKHASRGFLEAALREARDRGFDEAILLGEQGEVRECCGANLFLVETSGTVVTPTLVDGFLPGVTRGRLCRILREHGIPVRERTVFAEELEDAREVFLTNAVQGILPAASVEERILPETAARERWLRWIREET